MITAAQLRAARALASLDQRALAEVAGLSVPTIQRMEASDGVIRGNVDSLTKLVSALENAGVELIGEGASSRRRREGRAPTKCDRRRAPCGLARQRGPQRRVLMPVALFLLCDAALLVLAVVAVLLRRRSAATAIVYGGALVLSLALLAGALVHMVGRSFSGGHCLADRPALGRREFSA